MDGGRGSGEGTPQEKVTQSVEGFRQAVSPGKDNTTARKDGPFDSIGWRKCAGVHTAAPEMQRHWAVSSHSAQPAVLQLVVHAHLVEPSHFFHHRLCQASWTAC